MNADSRIRGFADFAGKPSKEHELRIVRRIVFRTIAVR